MSEEAGAVIGTDKEAISTAFVRAAEPQLAGAYRLAGYLLADAAEAEDATQEALLRAWQGWTSLRNADKFEAWFDHIVVNVCRNRLRGRRGIRPLHFDDAVEARLHAPDPFQTFLARDELGALVRLLEPDQQTVIALRYWRDLSLEEIAQRLKVPIGTVKSRLHYALRRLSEEHERQQKELGR